MSLGTTQLASARMYLADAGTSAVQSILIENAIDGTFTVSFDGQTTADIAYGAGANVLQNDLTALSNIGVGNVTAVNTSPYVINFVNALGNVAQPMFTVDDGNLIGLNVTVTVSQVTAGGNTAFTDDELNSLYSDAGSNFFLAICYGFRTLQASASKFNDYTAGQTKELKAQIFDHLTALAEMYQMWAFSGQQVQIAGLAPVPPRSRAWPSWPPLSGANLNMTPGNTNRWRRNGWGGN